MKWRSWTQTHNYKLSQQKQQPQQRTPYFQYLQRFQGNPFRRWTRNLCKIVQKNPNCKIVQKNTALPELFNLRFNESQNASDPQVQAIYEMVKAKDTEIQQKVHRMNRYYSQLVNDFHVRDNVLWIDDKLLIPNTLHKGINNRLHYYHHGNPT